MRRLDVEVLVIGGGATGLGIVRDAALRGYRTALVERRDLSDGTTGRYHGLLHSGGRYVVKDPQAAVECIEENNILRRIMPHCMEDTGGFFVTTPGDDPDYANRFVAGCQRAGIPCEELSVTQMLREEPALNPGISRCFRVPDAAADSFYAGEVNAADARAHGAQVLTYHPVTALLREGDRVVGAECLDVVADESVAIHADIVVNATGAWAGKVAALAGIEVKVMPGKGTMLAFNHRLVNTVVNRLKMPADGDIIVPVHTVSIIGTTDEHVADPDHFAIEPWEVQLMLDEAEKLVPGAANRRVLRAWAGVRPLYQETAVADSRDVTRAYALLDHATRDGVEGFLTITGGKWTTYRQMAEKTVDRVGEKLGTQRPCTTHLNTLPDFQHEPRTAGGYYYLGSRLARTEATDHFGRLICECEMVTRDDVEQAIEAGEAKSLDDIRRDTRLGMGPCQGGFCTYRAAAILHQLRPETIATTNVALRDFLQERWKGLLPILWGAQLKQERLDELVYLSVLNVDHLPGPAASPLGPVMYEPGTVEERPDSAKVD